MSVTILRELARAGVTVEAFAVTSPAELPDQSLEFAGVRTHLRRFRWEPGRWYSKHRLSAYISQLVARAAQEALVRKHLKRRHREDPFDVVLQLSQPETLLALPRLGVPVAVYLCSQAVAEHRHYRRESAFAVAAEGRTRHLVTSMFLALRGRMQRRAVQRATLILGPSHRFCGELARDLNLPVESTAVLRHPIDLERFSPGDHPEPRDRLRLLFVSRLSSRKGLDLILDLSRRLADRPLPVEIVVVGEGGLWSNYEPHISALNPRAARAIGVCPADRMPDLYRGADGVLVPSYWEPGSLVMGEALASGLPVVASSVVGPAEVVGEPACLTFQTGDAGALECRVRDLVAALRRDPARLRAHARHEAQQFAPEVVTKRLVELLTALSTGRTPTA
jgi:glycosyltransferase involved in cell wall biosynthesis